MDGHDYNAWVPPPSAYVAMRTTEAASGGGRIPRSVVGEVSNSFGAAAAKRGLDEASPGGLPVKRARSMSPVWSESTHRMFVEAIYQVGIKHASPSVILENMTLSDEAVTSERVKSHLQKYRKNKKKSKEEFMREYESWMQKALAVGAAGGGNAVLASPVALIEMMGMGNLLGGDVAALLAYSTMAEDSHRTASSGIQPDATLSMIQSGHDVARFVTGAKIPFPTLSEEERRSFLGTSIGHVVSLFYSMTQYIMSEREAKKKEGNEVTPEEEVDGTNSDSYLRRPWLESGSTNFYENDDSRRDRGPGIVGYGPEADPNARTCDSRATSPVVKSSHGKRAAAMPPKNYDS